MDGFEKLEHKQLNNYDAFVDKGKFVGCRIPEGFQLIRVHTIFDVKVDGRYKRCVVADGNLIATPSESIYSGVVLLRGL